MSTLKRLFPLPVGLLALLAGGMFLVALRLAVVAQEVPPPTWNQAAIGPVGAGGAAVDTNGVYAVSSSGEDIWEKSDSFHYVYRSLDGDGQIVARVLGIQGTNDYVKAGVMLRESLDPGAANAMMLLAANAGTFFQSRASAGGLTHQALRGTNAATPCWVKLVRQGDWIGGYASADGAHWSLAGWEVLHGLPQQVSVGLAVTSHNRDGTLSTAWFDSFSLGQVNPDEVLHPFVGNGDGLQASYFNNRHLYGQPKLSRVDSQVDFDFWDLTHQKAAGAAEVQNRAAQLLGRRKTEEFAVRWSGELQAQFTEPYTLVVRADDGVRIWLDEKLLIEDMRCTPETNSVTINLVAGQKYLLRIEYFQNLGYSSIQLQWTSPSTPLRVIPQSQLYSQPTADANGLPLRWEQHYFGRTGVNPGSIANGNGLTVAQEWQRHGDPTNALEWGVPIQWKHGDIDWLGGSRGDAHYDNGRFTIRSHGWDIWQTRDSFHYLYRPLGTNGEMIAQVTALDSTNQFAKAGLMIRENLDGDARNAMILVTPGAAPRFQWRTQAGLDEEESYGDPNLVAPCWLKIARDGDVIGGYTSRDGAHWALVGDAGQDAGQGVIIQEIG